MEVLNVLAQSTSSQYNDSGSALFGGFFLLIWLVVFLLAVAGLWKTFEKAGQPGWASIIPIYNTYVLIKVAGRPAWWLLLFLIPFVNIVVSAIVAVDVARAFGRSELFGVIGLWLFSIIGYMMIGFGEDTYQGPNTTNLAS